MIVYRFSTFQVGLVASGAKRRTIRAVERKGGHASPGDAIRLAAGRPSFKAIADAVCTAATPVSLAITRGGAIERALVDGTAVSDLEEFARLDGFAGAAEMGAFFRKLHGPGLFSGVMIQW